MGLSASVDITVKARFAFDGGAGSSKDYADLLAGRHCSLDNSWWSQALVPENMSRGKPLECFSLGEVDEGLSCKPTF